MTKVERNLVLDWSDDICQRDAEAKQIFEQLQDLCVERGYGGRPCALDAMLEYLLSSSDEAVRRKTLNLYARYQRFSAIYESMMELCQGFANLSRKNWQVSKGNAANTTTGEGD